MSHSGANLGKQAAGVKVRAAMAWVQDAQRSLSVAAEQLSPVRGGAREHARLLRLYDKVHSMWYRLEKLAGRPRIDLDRAPSPSELEAIAAEVSQ